MQHIVTSIEIPAPPEVVWHHLTDFEAYPAWNPFVREISGPLVRGQRLSVRIKPEGRAGMKFSPKVLVCEPGVEFRWRGNLLFPGLFDGEHYFQISRSKLGGVLFTHGERFSGILASLIMYGSAKLATTAGFESMNRALKLRCLADPRSQRG